MKKLISIILVITMAVALFACGKKTNNETVSDPETQIETDIVDKIDEESENNTEAADDKSDAADKPESKPADKKPAASTGNTASTPENKPAENTQKPEVKPETKPETTPEVKPETKPESTAATLGNTLLADFKAKAEGKSTQQIADALLANPAIKFSGGAASVEEGLLSGFGNTEITGFKSGTMFAPMIGSIPFVGYIFELESSADVSAFISKLKSNADLRWNICVEADEMITGSVGSKVFFVMCPTTLED